MKSLTANHVNVPAFGTTGVKVSLQRGLSLVELMISITIGLLILAALTGLFVNQSKTRAELEKYSRMIDNGRYSLEVLSDNLSMAGFYGEFEPTLGATPIPAIPGALPDPCTTVAADISAALQLAVQGYNADAQGSQIASAPCGFIYTAGDSNLSLKAGSDILAMRRASTATPIVQGAALGGTHYIQASRYQLDAVPYIVGTDSAAFTLRKINKDGTVGFADLRNFLVQVYFVAPSNNATVVVPGSGCTIGDCIPTLKRRELDPTTHEFVTTPLVEGVDYMQVDYGLDTTGAGGVPDGAPDSYVAAPATTNDWVNVVAVKISILARNTETTQGYTDTKTYALGKAGTFGPFNDHYKRHVYTKFIRLINPAGRR